MGNKHLGSYSWETNGKWRPLCVPWFLDSWGSSQSQICARHRERWRRRREPTREKHVKMVSKDGFMAICGRKKHPPFGYQSKTCLLSSEIFQITYRTVLASQKIFAIFIQNPKKIYPHLPRIQPEVHLEDAVWWGGSVDPFDFLRPTSHLLHPGPRFLHTNNWWSSSSPDPGRSVFFFTLKRTSWSFGLLQTTTSCDILIDCNVWIIDRKKYTDMRILNLKTWSNNRFMISLLRPSGPTTFQEFRWAHELWDLVDIDPTGLGHIIQDFNQNALVKHHQENKIFQHQIKQMDFSLILGSIVIMQLWGPFQLHKPVQRYDLSTSTMYTGIHGLHGKDSSHRASKMIMGKAFRLIPTYYWTNYVTMFHIPTIKLPPHFTAPVLLIISRTYQLSLYRQPFPDIKINDTCHNVIRS